MKFRELITNYDIGHLDGITQAKLVEIQHFIYTQSGFQIFNEMTHNPQLFIASLQNMPRYKEFDQYEMLFNDNQLRMIFSTGFREFALSLMQITFKYIPIQPDLTFFLESIGPEYMSVVTHSTQLHR